MPTDTLFKHIELREEAVERLREALDKPDMVLENPVDVERNLREGLALLRAAFKIKDPVTQPNSAD